MDLASKANRVAGCLKPWPGISARSSAGAPNSSPWARRSVAAPAGCCCRGRRATGNSPINHCHTLGGGTPMLALDMYEHSCHVDFGAKAATYVDAFMDAIRWRKAAWIFQELTDEGRGATQSGN